MQTRLDPLPLALSSADPGAWLQGWGGGLLPPTAHFVRALPSPGAALRELRLTERAWQAAPGAVSCPYGARGRSLALWRVPGPTLQSLLDADPARGLPQAAEVSRVLVSTLARLHAAGLVHGDLKPSNVLLTPSGQPVLIDFGQSSSLGAAPEARWPGRGRPGYAHAPQVWDAGIQSPATDRWSLEALSWRLQVGSDAWDAWRAPLRALSPAEVAQALQSAPWR